MILYRKPDIVLYWLLTVWKRLKNIRNRILICMHDAEIENHIHSKSIQARGHCLTVPGKGTITKTVIHREEILLFDKKYLFLFTKNATISGSYLYI